MHELCHGLAACLLGDDTAKRMGRLTLDPFAHIDIFGLICMVIAGFGWAKPVPVNPGNFKKPKLYTAIVALAGPVSNIVLSFIFTLLTYVLLIFIGGSVSTAIASFLYTCAMISAGFAVFNIFPIPPLDGSKLLIPFLPDKVLGFIAKYEGYIRLIFMIVVVVGLLDPVIVTVRNAIMDGMSEMILSFLLKIAGF